MFCIRIGDVCSKSIEWVGVMTSGNCDVTAASCAKMERMEAVAPRVLGVNITAASLSKSLIVY